MASRRDKRNIQGSAIQGAGAVTAGTGLLAGGIPGAKSDFTSVLRAGERMEGTHGKKGARKAASTARAASPALKAIPGGILGFRIHAHQGGQVGFEQEARRNNRKPPKDNVGSFYRGRNEGKIPAEAKVLRGMKIGRGVANAALVGGGAAAVYGAKRRKNVSKRDRRSDSYNATLAGAGGTGAVVSHGGAKFLDSKRKNYAAAASRHVDEAGELVPAISGRQSNKNMRQYKRHLRRGGTAENFPKTMHPSISDGAIAQHPNLLAGVSRNTARKAGHLRGMAAQERHFADVFGSSAKVTRAFRTPSAIVGAVGAGGLVVGGQKKRKIQKNSTTSAFGVDHGY